MLDLILFSGVRKIKVEKIKEKTNTKSVLWDKNVYFGCNTSAKYFERRQISKWRRGIWKGLEKRKQIITLQLFKMKVYQKWLDKRWSFEIISCQADGDKLKEDRGINDTVINTCCFITYEFREKKGLKFSLMKLLLHPQHAEMRTLKLWLWHSFYIPE